MRLSISKCAPIVVFYQQTPARLKQYLFQTKKIMTTCNYHQMVQLDATGQFRVNSSCADLSTSLAKSWFTLPPLMEFYYRKSHPSYRTLPPFHQDCQNTSTPPMAFIYPRNGSRISLIKNFEGRINEVVLKLAHTHSESEVNGYLDEKYVCQTRNFLEIGLLLPKGKHRITTVDGQGNEVSICITIE